MIEAIIGVIGLVIFVTCVYQAVTIAEIRRRINEKIEESVPDVALSPYEIERLERELEFDARIEEIKNELALRQQERQSTNIADELHPMVKNLPHNTITDNQQAPDIEYAD